MQNKIELEIILNAQKFEINEYYIYKNLSENAKDNNRKILNQLALDSQKHYQYWENITGKKIKKNNILVWLYTNLTKIFGLTFGIKLMEKSEKRAEEYYKKIDKIGCKYEWIIEEEIKHEAKVAALIDEDFLNYVSSIILGSNDALVELTGTLAGLTLALQNNKLIGATGLITGLSAALSMASSEYLSTKSEIGKKQPIKAAFYTGGTYVLTVIFLIVPYFVAKHYFWSLGLTLLNAALVILFFSFYISVIQGVSFRKRFMGNFLLSFGVAFLSFIIGLLVRQFLHLEV